MVLILLSCLLRFELFRCLLRCDLHAFRDVFVLFVFYSCDVSVVVMCVFCFRDGCIADCCVSLLICIAYH